MFLDAERKNKQNQANKKKKNIVLDAVRETAS